MKISVDLLEINTELNLAVVRVEVDGVGKVKLYPTPVWKSAYQRCVEITLVELRDALIANDGDYGPFTNEFTPEEWERIKGDVHGIVGSKAH